MPLAISVPNFWITSTGPGKNTGGKSPDFAIVAHATITGTNGNTVASHGLRLDQRTYTPSRRCHGETPSGAGAAAVAVLMQPSPSPSARSSPARAARAAGGRSA